jgi:hypothetical protein
MINAVGNRLDPVAILCGFDRFTFYGKSPFLSVAFSYKIVREDGMKLWYDTVRGDM